MNKVLPRAKFLGINQKFLYHLLKSGKSCYGFHKITRVSLYLSTKTNPVFKINVLSGKIKQHGNLTGVIHLTYSMSVAILHILVVFDNFLKHIFNKASLGVLAST